MAIWQDLVDGHGFVASYQSVKRFLNKLRGSSTPEARVVIETAPGEEAQVDYGSARFACCTTVMCSSAVRVAGALKPQPHRKEENFFHCEGAALALPRFIAFLPE